MYESYSKTLQEFYGSSTKIIDDVGTTREIGFDCSIREDEGRFLYDLVREAAPEETLEIGLAWGGSAIHILCAIQDGGRGHHIAIDPMQDVWSNLGVREPARLGLGHRLTCLHERSDETLPRFLSEGRRFQFAFIDGDHRFDAVFVDFYYIAKLLDVGGIMVFDDAGADTIKTVRSFVHHNMRNFDLVSSRFSRFAIYRKTREDDRLISTVVPFATPVPMGGGVIASQARVISAHAAEAPPN